VTFVIAVNSRESTWVAADRRLTLGNRVISEDACKIMCLSTIDGTAILGYAGLGRTTGRTEPSRWMSNVLRGRNLPLERSLQVLADACKRELPRHLLRFPAGQTIGHNIIAGARLNGDPRIYSIDVVVAADGKQWFRHTRWVTPGENPRNLRIAIAGTGALYLMRDRSWVRELFRFVKASDLQKISPQAIADYLAGLNYRVHTEAEAAGDHSIGPRSVTVMRHRKGGLHKNGGSSHLYEGPNHDSQSSLSIPDIASGMDMMAISDAFISAAFAQTPRAPDKLPALDMDSVIKAITSLPDTPDERLR